MASPDAAADEGLLDAPDGTFEGAELPELPGPVQRYLGHAISPGTPRFRSARLSMRGHIKVGSWLPFRADEVLTPRRGFVWRARVAGRLMTGSDRYVGGTGAMAWRIAGLIPLVHASGPDVSKSGAGRAGGEGVWLPTATLPASGVTWSADGEDQITSSFEVDGVPVVTRYRLRPDGRVASLVFDRWGDPDRTGRWAWHAFGGDVTRYATFAGLRIPTAGRFGWRYGTERWPAGEFFRYEITRLDPVGG